MMNVIAATHSEPTEAWRLSVKTNPLCLLGCGHAIYVTYRDVEAKSRYRTISEFLDAWVIHGAQTRHIPVPFMKYPHGLGDVAGALFARLGIFPAPDCGCNDRKHWWNWLLVLTPLSWKGDAA